METIRDRRSSAKPPTLNDVAAAAGVSRQTVSNVLNRPERVRPATRARVKAAVEGLGYRPNRMARSLQTNSSCMLGFQVPRGDGSAHNPLMGTFLDRLAGAAHARGYQLLLVQAGRDPVAAFAELHQARLLDGVVLAEVERNDPRPARLRTAGIPHVAFGATDAPAWVDVDGSAGAAAAVRHLVARGHDRIAFVGWPEGSQSGDRRVEGFLAETARAGVTVAPALLRVRNSLAAGRASLDALLDAEPRPTAVIAVSDLIAAGLLQAASERGVRVPDDLAVVGYDDSPIAALLCPPLTSVRQPLGAAAEALIDRITIVLAGAADVEPLLLPPEVVPRAST